MTRRAYTAPASALRCVAHARTAVKGEGAQCMRRRAPGFDLCAQHVKIAANAPMPCGFIRENVKLKARLTHYRQCLDPACQARDMAARAMLAQIRDDLTKQKGKP